MSGIKMKHFNIRKELRKADYLHVNRIFVANSQVDLKSEIGYLNDILSK